MNQTDRFLDHLAQLESRLDEINGKLGDPQVLGSPSALKSLGQERAGIEEIVGLLRMYRSLRDRLEDAEEMSRSEGDAEMVELAQAEIAECGPGLDYMFRVFPFNKTLQMVFTGSGECAEVSWRLLGLGMPAWVLICFIVLGSLGLYRNWRA